MSLSPEFSAVTSDGVWLKMEGKKSSESRLEFLLSEIILYNLKQLFPKRNCNSGTGKNWYVA